MFSLYIDTTQNNNRFLLIRSQAVIGESTFEVKNNSDSQFLSKLDSFMKFNRTSTNNIDNFLINVGPGTFTGTRIGVSFANALKLTRPEIKLVSITGQLSNDQIIGHVSQKDPDFLVPEYIGQPSITKTKK